MSQNKALKSDIKEQKGGKVKIPKKITENFLYNSGLAYLQRYPASIAHFKRVMTRKIDRSCAYHTDQSRDECLKLLENLVQKFTELGLLNNEAYLTGMVTSMRRRGLSRKLILMKLIQKGLPEDQILRQIDSFDGENNVQEGDLTAALILARKKKLGCFSRLDKDQDFQKQLAVLGRAGFGYETARKTLETPETEALEIINCLQ